MILEAQVGDAAGIKRHPDIYLPKPATLIECHPVTKMEKFFTFQMESDEGFEYLPGQFMEVSIPGIGEAPISITSSVTASRDNTFEMVVRNVGNVSGAMHLLEVGQRVGVRGPFGKSFPVDGAMRGRDVLFICGGIGLVPVRSAIRYVLDMRQDYGEVTILYGTRRPEDRLFTEELFNWKTRDDVRFWETVDAADPSWGGNVGVITALIRMASVDPEKTIAIVCGPPIMYKFVLMELERIDLPYDRIYMSLERHMKCGVGKCGHCQINGLYACQDGPVFKYSDILGVKEAI